jgi:N-acetylglucosamine-6-phosphate deacetylase
MNTFAGTSDSTIFAKHALIEGQWRKNTVVTITNSKIASIMCDASSTLSAQSTWQVEYLTPSYIDVQVNGGGGILLGDQVTPDDLLTVAKVHQAFGTGALLPTLITNHSAAMERMADSTAAVIAQQTQANTPNNTHILGVHFEGPWLASAKKGIHLAQHIRPPSDRELQCVTRTDMGKVKITLAPESVSVDVIQDLVNQGVIVSLGHTNADIDTTLAAIAAGASGFTHLFNAMSGFTGRAPGVLGAALSHQGTYAGLIMDLHHVHPASIQAAIHAKGLAYSVLVTDAMGHVGANVETLPYFDLSITRSEDKLTTPNGSLAGSCLTMHQAVCNTLTHCAVNWEQAIAMASLHPANWLGLDDIGAIRVGYIANLLGSSLSQDETDLPCTPPTITPPKNTQPIITHHWVRGQYAK